MPLLLLASYHVYLVHMHTIAVAGLGTVSESMIKAPAAPVGADGSAAAP